ncbi:MAG: hypothetical protein UX09_C0035G0014 [Candidatus Uhrbacteria bacterium GW2011_GWE2_45_35]|uniref:Haloacid dehalogenase domain protein hydrolase n=2 Tax=Candidatus Uhriibacteriota TaxID=1752732 RepID=A0A0G1JG37_9BACT|nr:MAG: hypothetical protein UW63_C0029G0007 [Candidatus Uhrbacteria bacterium GW2011_GWF2_44_350]KKU07083.1 MAG: hypothetical protein UX09_C0035G0014 [Candidatus Uhrbacteria bacterium GW2011_GWE2_45_35]HBR80218.1 hypothetical protein [Candidatus Uhrbacteria bacterium]HCU31805.1 hypothetical protein [Candidatus Uhrbacteria bacterium]
MSFGSVFEFSTFELFQRALPDLVFLAESGRPVLALNLGRGTFGEFASRVKVAEGLITDFDDTLTTVAHVEFLRKLMTPDDLQADLDQRSRWYGTPTLDESTTAQFVLATARRLRRLNLKNLVSVARQVSFHPGAPELLHWFAGRKGVVVVSLGYHDVIIRAVMIQLAANFRKNRVLVAAAEFAWRDGCCSGVDLGTIVAEATKGIKALDRCELLGLLTERSLILGDEPRGDRTLFALGGTSVLIFSANDSIPERIVRRTAALTEGVWNDLDAVLVTGGTLQPLVDLLR